MNRADGDPYLPGASIRGVLRAHLEREREVLGCTDEDIKTLFGKIGRPHEDEAETHMGRLAIYDCRRLTGQTETSNIRDHVLIEPESGAAQDKHKFDEEVLEKGAFGFRAVYEGDGCNEDLKLLEEALRALAAGEIRIGSRSAIGYGHFRISDLKSRDFARSTTPGLLAFVKSRMGEAKPLIDFAVPDGQVTRGDSSIALNSLYFTFDLYCEGPVLIRHTLPPPDIEVDHIYLSKIDGQPYLPGSSLRGVFRSHARRICRSQRTGPRPLEFLFGDVKQKGGGRKGMLEVEDSLCADRPEVGSDHVAVDRMTQAAADQKLFSDKALDSPTFDNVKLTVRFPDHPDARAAVALLLLVVRDLVHDERRLWLGSATTRGYGLVRKAGQMKISVNAVNPLAESVGIGVRTAEDVSFEALCAAFDPAWQSARFREVPA